MNRVLVTGGTGSLGKQVVANLLKKNYAVTVLSSGTGKPATATAVEFVHGNLATGAGLQNAAAAADMVIHCASDPLNFEQADLEGTRNLLQCINREKTRHFVYISIVGVDKSSFPYYRAKYAVENMIAASGIPFSILRSTQFHSFILYILQTFIRDQRDNILKIPAGMKFQSIDIREVAKKLVDGLGEAAGLLPDFGGPEVLAFEDMVQAYCSINKLNPEIQPAIIKEELYDLFRSGVNLCSDNRNGKITWKDFLEEQAGTA